MVLGWLKKLTSGLSKSSEKITDGIKKVIKGKKIDEATLNELEEKHTQTMGELFLAVKKIASDKGISESGYRTVFNCNKDAQQTVFHIHLHLIAGRKMTWPPG